MNGCGPGAEPSQPGSLACPEVAKGCDSKLGLPIPALSVEADCRDPSGGASYLVTLE